jgi:cation:H+ antiporter
MPLVSGGFMESLSLPVLITAFVIAAGVVWWAGVRLSNATDTLDKRFGWGEALGGLVLLALATNLPEIAIVVSAGLGGTIDIATGNLLGGIAVQTLVLAVLDIAGGGSRVPLTSRTRTLVPVIEATVVIGALTLLLLGSQVEPLTVARIEPTAVVIVLVWLSGLLVVRRAKSRLLWKLDDPEPSPPAEQQQDDAGRSTGAAAWVFAGAAALTLLGGVVLERASDAIAADIGMGSAVFGATVLAAATAIPEVATGLQAVRLGDHQLAISDIFGGNAFLPTLFLLAGAVSGQAVISGMTASDTYLAALGIIVTCLYLVGLVYRNHGMFARMGYDSLLVVVVYAAGVLGLVLIGGG